jgi:hypothetical protein
MISPAIKQGQAIGSGLADSLRICSHSLKSATGDFENTIPWLSLVSF